MDAVDLFDASSDVQHDMDPSPPVLVPAATPTADLAEGAPVWQEEPGPEAVADEEEESMLDTLAQQACRQFVLAEPKGQKLGVQSCNAIRYTYYRCTNI